MAGSDAANSRNRLLAGEVRNETPPAPIPDAKSLASQAQQMLSDSPIRILRHLRVERNGSALVLTGSVSSFYQKQLAQELVRSVAHDCELVNSIAVD